MGDDQGCVANGNLLQLTLDGAFCGRVERGGGFVEYQNGWVFEQGPGNGNTLFFATGKLQSSFPDAGFVLEGQGFYEIV